MTTTITTSNGISLDGSTQTPRREWLLSVSVLSVLETFDDVIETRAVLEDPDLMEQLRRGEDAVARGDLRSFEQVFGEPF